MVTARAASQRKPPLSDLSNESYPFHWKRHGDADDAGADRGRNFCTAPLSNWTDLNENERRPSAPTRSRLQLSRQRHGQNDECAHASSGWQRLQSDSYCWPQQYNNGMNTWNFRNAARRPKSANRCWQLLGICDDTPLSSHSQAWTEPPEYPGRRRDAFIPLGAPHQCS
jgi:hypothetical protein